MRGKLWMGLLCGVFLASCGSSGPLDPDDDDVFVLESATLTPDRSFCRITGTVRNTSNRPCSVDVEFTFRDSAGTIVADAFDFIADVPANTRSAYSTTAIDSRQTGGFLSCQQAAALTMSSSVESGCL